MKAIHIYFLTYLLTYCDRQLAISFIVKLCWNHDSIETNTNIASEAWWRKQGAYAPGRHWGLLIFLQGNGIVWLYVKRRKSKSNKFSGFGLGRKVKGRQASVLPPGRQKYLLRHCSTQFIASRVIYSLGDTTVPLRKQRQSGWKKNSKKIEKSFT